MSMDRQVIRKRWLIRLTFIFIFLAILWSVYYFFFSQFEESTDDAYVAGNAVTIMPYISGRINQIHADETDLVTQGQILIQLDKTDAAIQLKSAAAQLGIVVRQVNKLYQDVNAAEANVLSKKDALQKAQEDYQRRQGLMVNRTISEEDLRHAKLALDSAQDDLKSAQDQLAAALSLIGNTDLYHHPQVLKAIATLRTAYLNWQRTTVYAPASGYVAKRSAQVGQEVTPQSVLMVIIPLNQLWVDANFKESQLKDIRINQPAVMTSDLYGSNVKYHGTVIGLNPGTGSSFDLLPPQNATGNWIKIVQRLPVRISLDPKELAAHPLRIGLSMTVAVDTHRRGGGILTLVAQDKVVYESKDYSADLSGAERMIDQILQSSAPNLPPPVTK